MHDGDERSFRGLDGVSHEVVPIIINELVSTGGCILARSHTFNRQWARLKQRDFHIYSDFLYKWLNHNPSDINTVKGQEIVANNSGLV